MKLREFDGVQNDRYGTFMCPGCKDTHTVQIKGNNAWGYNNNPDSPTLSPSVLVREYEGTNVRAVCHSFVKDGHIQFLGDCSHGMAGQTVQLPEIKLN